ncbi:hypothetical protein D3C85_1580650 [compost metagenome]
MHHAVVADLQRALLFRVRQQQVLGQAPVEEQADAVDFHHFEAGKAADLHLGFEGGSQRTVFAVQIKEDVQPVPDFAGLILWHISIGQQDLTIRTAVQVQAEVGVLDHLK